jgi:hypothetical protein
MLESCLHVAVQAEKQALRVKLRRAGSSAADVVSIPAAAEQEQQQPQQQPQQQQQQQQPESQSRAAQVYAVAQPDMAGPAADSVPGEHGGAEAAGAAASPDSTAEAVSAPATAILRDDNGADDAAEQQHRSRRIAAAATAAVASARAAAADATAAGPSVAVLQQLLPWRVMGQGAEAAGAAEPMSPAAVASMSADEAVRWATQRHAATLSGIHRTLEQLAEEKRSCLAALEAQQVGNISTYCSCRLATAHRLHAASPAMKALWPHAG